MGGVEYTKHKIAELSNSALKDLEKFENKKYKDSLSSAIYFNINRNRKMSISHYRFFKAEVFLRGYVNNKNANCVNDRK